ncbi:MAG: family acetyltransferase [Chitinophagaceae bacterium]|nr:family acetyltransferase [Chitinophagaceae bacterium]
MITIEHEDDGKHGLFKAVEGSKEAGSLAYSWAGETKFTIDHTEVDAAFGGKGIGKQLVMEAVKMAREKKVKIIPICPFAKSLFDKMKEIQDVLW